MLDILEPTADGSELSVFPVLLGQAYSLIGEEGNIPKFLSLVAARFNASAARLMRVGRGEDVELGSYGKSVEVSTRIEGQTEIDGRSLVLTLASPQDITVSELAALQDLLIHVERAVSISAKLEAFEVERAIGSQLLNKMAVGTVFLDRNLQVVTMTGLAETMVQTAEGLRLRAGRLVATDSSDDRILQAEIRAVLSGDDPATTDVLRLCMPQRKRHIGLVVQPVDSERHSGRIACAVVIRDGARMSEPQTDMLRRYFDLTAAEALLTRSLAGGLTLDEAAEHLNIRRNTARAHLRAIFSKCGVKRQTELMRLVLASVAMLGANEVTSA